MTRPSFKRRLTGSAARAARSCVMVVAMVAAAMSSAAAVVRSPYESTLRMPADVVVRPIHTKTLFHALFANFAAEKDRTTYVATGDIPAMWLRDSAAQTLPYVRFAARYPALRARFSGVIEREARNILINPHAEAFGADYSVWEGKWEIDSLAWPVMLVFVYYTDTHDRTIFTPTLHSAMETIVATFSCEQRHAACSRYSWPYAVPTKKAYNPKTGMIWSAFRPSDDPVAYRFNVPQNAMAVVALRLIARFARSEFRDAGLAERADILASQVRLGIERYGRVYDKRYGGWLYAYETDGYGHANMMDDANIPNLTTLPYIGWCSNHDPVYVHTRRFTLSRSDPYYYTGKYASGLGSPHTPKGWVWPLGIVGAALTASSRSEVAEAIEMLDRIRGPNGLMHESVSPGDPYVFTRQRFGWANAFWADLLFHAAAGYRATSQGVLGTIAPGERRSRTPAIAPAWMERRNRASLIAELGRLLSHPTLTYGSNRARAREADRSHSGVM